MDPHGEVFDASGDGVSAEELRAKRRPCLNGSCGILGLTNSAFYAYALDGDKSKVFTIASECRPLSLVWHRASERAKIVVGTPDGTAMMMERDGDPPRSRSNPAYNPYKLSDWCRCGATTNIGGVYADGV